MEFFQIGDGGLSPYCPLLLAALGGEAHGAAALLSSMGALKSFLFARGGVPYHTQRSDLSPSQSYA
jgi:hypothetical protein